MDQLSKARLCIDVVGTSCQTCTYPHREWRCSIASTESVSTAREWASVGGHIAERQTWLPVSQQTLVANGIALTAPLIDSQTGHVNNDRSVEHPKTSDGTLHYCLALNAGKAH